MTERHRGPGPRDRELFADSELPVLRAAAGDLAWLLGRGYNDTSALKLVGDRYGLAQRQRLAVSRSTCSDLARSSRLARRVGPEALAGRTLHVDGFNVLIVIESILSGGLVLVGRDRAHRDLASVHGTWRRVSETAGAIEVIASLLSRSSPREIVIWLDRPVSNSGRLAGLLRATARERGIEWQVELAWDPDRELMARGEGNIVATSDARILDAVEAWIDLPGAVAQGQPSAWVVDLGGYELEAAAGAPSTRTR